MVCLGAWAKKITMKGNRGMKEFFLVLGAGVSFLGSFWYVLYIRDERRAEGLKTLTPASFLMWTVLDIFISWLLHGLNKPIGLSVSYALGAFMVMIVTIVHGAWRWTSKETICAGGVIATSYVLHSYGIERAALVAVEAMMVAGLPVLLDLWREPVRDSWPLWVFAIVACALTLLGSDWWNLKSTALAWSGVAYNGAVLSVVCLKKPVAVKAD